MTEFEKELKKEGEELEKLLSKKVSRPEERHTDLAPTEPLAAAELSRDLLNELKGDLKDLRSKIRKTPSILQTTPEKS